MSNAKGGGGAWQQGHLHAPAQPCLRFHLGGPGGFWASLQAVQTEGAPTFKIVPATPGNAAISWPPPLTNWILQENVDLTTTNWVNSVGGSTNPVTVLATQPQKYYRLFRL